MINTGNPKHADILVITGSVNEQNKEVIQNIYAQMPDPKVVVAVGACASSGGIFSECYNVAGGVDRVLPVDVYVPGCAARPEAIIDGAVKALGVLAEKRSKFKSMSAGLEHLEISVAGIEDAEQILVLQKLAFQSEAEIYNDFNLSPLKQTLDELKGDFKSKLFLKAIMDGRIVGSVRACLDEEVLRIGRLVVHPTYQNLGIGRKLMCAVEAEFSGASGYEVFTGHKSKRNIFFYKQLGYKPFKSAKVSDKRDRIYLEKPGKKEDV
jgi:Ni,Fe-hydrogenase III small subunit/predicted N-acetyltransferase YhbS